MGHYRPCVKYKKISNYKKKDFKITSLDKEKIYIEKDIFIEKFLKIFFKNYNLWCKSGFSFIKENGYQIFIKKMIKLLLNTKIII